MTKEYMAVVGCWRFVCAPTYMKGGERCYEFFAVPGGKIVSRAQLERWAKTHLNKEVYYVPF